MNLLVVSADPTLARLLADMLASEPCTVVACATLAEALAEASPVAALVLEGWEGRVAPSMIREIRAAGGLTAGAPVIVISADSPVPGTLEALGAVVLTKPANLLKVMDQLRSVLVANARPGTPTQGFGVGGSRVPPSGRDIAAPRDGGDVMASARSLARWWCSRATGVLTVPGHGDAFALLAQGGPVGPEGLAAVRQALLGCEACLERCEVDEPGDRAALAAMLWRAAHEAVVGQSVMSLIPVPNGLTRAASGLPLGPGTRRCLERLGGVSVDRLARRERATPQEVCLDMAALRWLGLIGLRDPADRGVDIEVDAPSSPPTVGDSHDDLTSHPSPTAPAIVLERLVGDGIAAVSRGDWGRADELLSRAHARAPENAEILAHLGWARFQNPVLSPARRMVEGTELVETALEADPDCALAWRYCGELAFSRGDLLEATRCFGVALKILTGPAG